MDVAASDDDDDDDDENDAMIFVWNVLAVTCWHDVSLVHAPVLRARDCEHLHVVRGLDSDDDCCSVMMITMTTMTMMVV